MLWARVSDEKIYSHDSKVHLVLALDKKTVLIHQDSLEPGGVIIFDEKQVRLKDEEKSRKDINYIPLPLLETAKEKGGQEIMFNTVGLGAAFAMMGAEIEIYKEILKKQFEKKGAELVKGNQAAAQAGYDLGLKHRPRAGKVGGDEVEVAPLVRGRESVGSALPWSFPRKKRSSDQAYLLSGNQAVTYGAVNAGCKLLCSYPMTPTSAVMEYFGELEHSHKVVLKHVEDEVTALNMAIGAWHTGCRTIVSTAGGGFALMVEAMGFAGVSEAGPVIYLGMRPGPGTGMPTYTSQGDLRFALHAGQDEFPRVIIAPGDNEECFYQIQEAFNLGDEYQVPVIVLSDKFLGESHFTTPELDDQKIPIKKGKVIFDKAPKNYNRYDTSAEDGISARTVPGVKDGIFVANSYDHDEHGYAAEESEMRIRQVEKRHKKQLKLQQVLPMPKLYGDEKAKLTIICWGSTKLVALEAMRQLEKEGKKINVLHFSYIYPLDWEKLKTLLGKFKKTLIVEGNNEGLLQGLLRQYTGFEPTESYHRIDGRAFYPEEIVEAILNLEL